MLSNQRATETIAYFQSQLDNKNRVFGKGYGETNPKIDCKCDEPTPVCTVTQQKLNRRSEFFIIK